MTSQLPALYLQKNKTVYRNQYIERQPDFEGWIAGGGQCPMCWSMT